MISSGVRTAAQPPAAEEDEELLLLLLLLLLPPQDDELEDEALDEKAELDPDDTVKPPPTAKFIRSTCG